MGTISIGLLFTHNLAYFRDVLRGVRRHGEARPEWLFTSIVPEQQSLQTLRRFQHDGLIAAVNIQGPARNLRAWHRPVVNVFVSAGARRIGASVVRTRGLVAYLEDLSCIVVSAFSPDLVSR